MPELVDRLRADHVAARKQSDRDRTVLLGTVLAALQNKEIEVGHALDDAAVTDVLRRQIKQRQDSITQYAAGGRPDLVAQESGELDVLQGYLPPELDPAVIRAAADQAVAQGNTDLGRLMGVLMGQFRGQADGKVINQIAREALQQG